MIRRRVVVGVLDALQIRLGRGTRKPVLDVLGPAARARREVGRDHVPPVLEHLALRPADGPVRPLGLAGEAAVDLAAGVVVDVERAAAPGGRERVAAGRERLCLQGVQRPGRRHLVGDHAGDVIVERELVDDQQRPARTRRDEVAAELPLAADLDLSARPLGDELPAAPGDPFAVAPFELHPRAAGDRPIGPAGLQVVSAGAPGPAELDRVGGRADQHPDLLAGPHPGDLRMLEVVGCDLPVVGSVLGVAVGTPLAHPDPMTVAVPGDHESLRRGRRGRRQQDHQGQQDEQRRRRGDRPEMHPACSHRSSTCFDGSDKPPCRRWLRQPGLHGGARVICSQGLDNLQLRRTEWSQ